MKPTVALLLCSILSASCMQAQRIRQLPNTAGPREDLVLPKAMISVEVHVVDAAYERGPAYQAVYSNANPVIRDFYATRYGVKYSILNALAPAPAGSIIHRYKLLEDSLKLAIVPVRDDSKRFVFEKMGAWNKDNALAMTYGPDGVVSGFEYTRKDKTFDLIVKGVGAVATIASAAMKDGKARTAAAIAAGASPIPELEEILDQMEALYTPGRVGNNTDIYKDLKARLEKQYEDAFAKYFYSTKKTIKPVQIEYFPTGIPVPAPGTTISVPVFKFNDVNGNLLVNNSPLFETTRADMVQRTLPGAGADWYTLEIIIYPATNQPMRYLADRSTTNKESRYAIPINAGARTLVALRKAPNGEIVRETKARIPQFGKLSYDKPRKATKMVVQYDDWGELRSRNFERTGITTEQADAANASLKELLASPAINQTEARRQRIEDLKLRQEEQELLKSSLEE